MAIRFGTNANEYFGNGALPAGFLAGGTLDTNSPNEVYAGGGDDIVVGGTSLDLILPGAGNDVVDGGAGVDTVSYADATAGVVVSLATTAQQNTLGAGLDTIRNVENLIGSDFADTLAGNDGVNVIWGGGGNDTIFARTGNDTVYGEDGDDLIEAGFGNDLVYGGEGNDTLRGQRDNDVLVGENGNDRLTAGKGSDLVVGGAGADRFAWTSGCVEGSNAYVDIITEMTRGDAIVHAGTTATIVGYSHMADSYTAGETRLGVAIDDDPTRLDAQIAMSTTVNGTTWTTTIWVLDVGNNALIANPGFIFIA